MQANEFWCRAFLAAMAGRYEHGDWENHGAPAAYCGRAADAALAAAQHRGIVTGERTASAIEVAALRWLNALRENNVGAAETAERDLLRAVEALDRGRSLAPELQRVGFMATQDPDNPRWCLVDIRDVGVVKVPHGCASFGFNGTVYRVTWTETMPPKPAELWIERPAKGGA